MNLLHMLDHSPALGRAFARLGGAILGEMTLSPRLREIAILRVGLLAGASYEVSKHLRIGEIVGLSGAEMNALRPGNDQAALGDVERAVVRFVDDLQASPRASDDVFNAVRSHLGDKQTLELVVTTGFYGMACRVLETLEIDDES